MVLDQVGYENSLVQGLNKDYCIDCRYEVGHGSEKAQGKRVARQEIDEVPGINSTNVVSSSIQWTVGNRPNQFLFMARNGVFNLEREMAT